MAAPHPPDSIAECLATHDELALRLREHQCTLVGGEIEAALASFLLFSSSLMLHLQAEEEVLIPEFEQHCQPPPAGCSAELLLAEHAKLRRLTAESEQRLRELTPSHGQLLPGQILDLIEGERSLREVLDHHDQRERAAFFPVLAAALGQATWTHLSHRFILAHESEGTSR